jgi:hypothetical protein
MEVVLLVHGYFRGNEGGAREREAIEDYGGQISQRSIKNTAPLRIFGIRNVRDLLQSGNSIVQDEAIHVTAKSNCNRVTTLVSIQCRTLETF